MPKWLAIVAYRNEFNGEPGGSVDIRVLGFDLQTEDQVRSAILSQPINAYENHLGEQVSWPIAHILSIEEFSFTENGGELIGFIAETQEIQEWASK